MNPRPADAARRALRAARPQRPAPTPDPEVPRKAEPRETLPPERTERTERPERPEGPERPVVDAAQPEQAGTGGGGDRPGDVAREALRAAVSARRGLGSGVGGAVESSGAAGASDPEGGGVRGPGRSSVAGDPSDHPTTTRGSGDRPGDVAREALRAAVSARRGVGSGSGGSEGGAVESSGAAGASVPEGGGVRGPDRPERPAVDVAQLDQPTTTRGSGDRPGDVAREALRAAASARRGAGNGTDGPEGEAAQFSGDTSALPAPHPVPRTMASPRRDGDVRRTFPALSARTAGESGFAETWWGEAWLDALEKGALDAARLARGRGYAERGHVDAITVTPGLVLAYVRGSRPRPYRVQVRVRTLDDADWDRFLDTAAERPGHIAALLDKEMPQSLADCGVPLLPGPGDLDPQCSCPDRGHPCKHAAALCYQTARLLDADPFVLLLLRGRGERELLDALSRLSAARSARAARERAPEPLPGVRAVDALAPRRLPPLPPPPPPPPHPEQPPVYPASPGGPDPFALDQLATDAAARAHALLTTGRDPVGGLTLWEDAVRLAAARPGSGLTAATRALYSSLASVTGRTAADLARAVAAWRQGGLEGLAVLEEPWDPPAGRFDRARPLLLAADLPAFRPSHNRLTHPLGHLQLRLGWDGLWYAYESEPGRDDWWPRGTPDLDPVGALTGLAAPGGL
ncbi:SWIM zinc finger family protein [Streptomyces sp. NPDC003393]